MPIRSITWARVRQEISWAYTAARIKSREFIPQYGLLASDHVAFLPFLLALPISLTPVYLMMGCWEHRVELDVANMARQKIFKKLTGKEEFREIINEAEDALQEEVKDLLSRLRQGEGKTLAPRMLKEYVKSQESLVDAIVNRLCGKIESKIEAVQRAEIARKQLELKKVRAAQEAERIKQEIEEIKKTAAHKKARFKAWLDELKNELAGVSSFQELAKETLNTTMREIFDDFNDRLAQELGVTLQGEIDKDGTALHTLAEVVVEKMLHRQIDFETALNQIVNHLFKAGLILKENNKEQIIELLKQAVSDRGLKLKDLFKEFRRDFLDPGPGTLLSVLQRALNLPAKVTPERIKTLAEEAIAIFELKFTDAIEDIIFDETDGRIDDSKIEGKSIKQLVIDEVLLEMLGEVDSIFASETFKEDFMRRVAKAIKESYFKDERIAAAELLEIINKIEIKPGKNLAETIVDWVNKNRIFEAEIVEEEVGKEGGFVDNLKEPVEVEKGAAEREEDEFAFGFEGKAMDAKNHESEE
jgi:hypothetical protein